MTPLERLEKMGYERVNRILAAKVMGWRDDGFRWIGSQGLKSPAWCLLSHVNLASESIYFDPCADLNHAKMVVDKLNPVDLCVWANYLGDIVTPKHVGKTITIGCFSGATITNASANARMAAVMEVLNLWEEKS